MCRVTSETRVLEKHRGRSSRRFHRGEEAFEDAIRLIKRLGAILPLKASPQPVERPASTPRPELVDRRARSHGLGVWWTFGTELLLAGAIIAAIEDSHAVRLHYLV